MSYVAAYAAATIVFFALDMAWLGGIASGFYKNEIGALLRPSPALLPAALFYLFYVAGIVYFAVHPALTQGTWKTAALSGLILGLLAYGTYDMTNLATLKGWSLAVSIVDMVWGGFLTATAAVAGYYGARLVG